MTMKKVESHPEWWGRLLIPLWFLCHSLHLIWLSSEEVALPKLGPFVLSSHQSHLDPLLKPQIDDSPVLPGAVFLAFRLASVIASVCSSH